DIQKGLNINITFFFYESRNNDFNCFIQRFSSDFFKRKIKSKQAQPFFESFFIRRIYALFQEIMHRDSKLKMRSEIIQESCLSWVLSLVFWVFQTVNKENHVIRIGN